MDIKNLSVVRQSFANTVFTHKVQEVAAERRDRSIFWVKITNIVLVSLVLIVLGVQIFAKNHPVLSYIAVGITVAEVIFLIVQTLFNFSEQKVQHKLSALKYLGLRDKYRNLITDIMNGNLMTSDIRARRDELQNEYKIISDFAPQTDRKDFMKAQRRLNKAGVVEGEDFTWSDEEIDRFLPSELRLKK